MRAIVKHKTFPLKGMSALALLLVCGSAVLFASPASAGGRGGVPTKLERKLTPIKKVQIPESDPVVNVVVPGMELPPVVPVGQKCHWAQTGATSTMTQVIPIQGRILDSCLGPWLVPGQTIVIPGGAVSTVTLVCY